MLARADEARMHVIVRIRQQCTELMRAEIATAIHAHNGAVAALSAHIASANSGKLMIACALVYSNPTTRIGI